MEKPLRVLSSHLKLQLAVLGALFLSITLALMFPDLDLPCLCGLCKKFAINFYDKLNVGSPPLLCKSNGKFLLTSVVQLSYSKFNATTHLSKITAYKRFPPKLLWKGCNSKLSGGVVAEGCFCLCQENQAEMWHRNHCHIRFKALLPCLVIHPHEMESTFADLYLLLQKPLLSLCVLCWCATSLGSLPGSLPRCLAV